MSKLRVGIIGAGGIAALSHLPGLAEQGDRAEVTLISGRKESRLKRLCERFSVPKFTQRFEDVLEDDSIDAVIISTPHPLHVTWGIKALQAGKHVMVEKPLCTDLAQADSFVAAAEAHPDRTTFCLPHYPDVVHSVRKLMREGVIGTVSSGRARTSHGGPEIYYREVSRLLGETFDESNLWFFDAKRAEVGALFDMGVYAVARMIALLGPVRGVSARTTTLTKPTTLEDTATVIMEFESGVLATAETSWCDPARTWEFSIHGTAGKYEFADGPTAKHSEPTVYDLDEAPIRVTEVAPDIKVGSLHSHWLDCIERREQPPLSGARAARHITQVLLAALASSRAGGTRQGL